MHLTAQPCPVYAVWTFLPSARFARSGKPVELNQVEERLSGIHVYSISNYINDESWGIRLCWIDTISSNITCRLTKNGTANTAPAAPASRAPIRIATMLTIGGTPTARFMTSGTARWFSISVKAERSNQAPG